MTTLYTVLHLLRGHFGQLTGSEAVRPWWPIFGPDPPFEILVGAVLVQQTRWETVEAAVLRLLAADLLRPERLAAADASALATHIRPAAFHTQKASGLIAIARHIADGYGGSTRRMLQRPTAGLRAELLALPRIGRETCDVVLLYGGEHAVFVVDEYTRRLFERVFLAGDDRSGNAGSSFPWRRANYEAVREQIEQELAATDPLDQSARPALFAEYHAQINEACVRYCLARPRCDGPPARRVYSRQAGRESYLGREDGCPLRGVCGYYEKRGDTTTG